MRASTAPAWHSETELLDALTRGIRLGRDTLDAVAVVVTLRTVDSASSVRGGT